MLLLLLGVDLCGRQVLQELAVAVRVAAPVSGERILRADVVGGDVLSSVHVRSSHAGRRVRPFTGESASCRRSGGSPGAILCAVIGAFTLGARR